MTEGENPDGRSDEDSFERLLEKAHVAIVSGESLDESLGDISDVFSGSSISDVLPCLQELERARTTLVVRPEDQELFLSRFRIHDCVGEGSYGIVYAATDTELGRKIALKVARPEVSLSPSLRRRFRHEATLSARLEHPGIVTVFDIGEIDGILFIASELCDGKSLQQWMEEHQGPIAIDTGVDFSRQIADAIAHAHRRGVLHRDLKPANILIEESTIKVSDFGLGRLDDDVSLTRTGAIVGTPAFMSPEQAAGNTADVGTASDVYSIGVLMYQLLTGRLPFEATDVSKMLQDIQLQTPTSVKKRRSEISDDLAAIIGKCLEKDLTQRYASAHDLATDLQNFSLGRPVVARMPGPLGRLKKTIQRQPVVSGLIALFFTSVLCGLIASMVYAQRASEFAAETQRQYRESKQVINDYYVQVSREPLFRSASFSEQKKRMLKAARQHFVVLLEENQNDSQLAMDLIQTRVYLAQAEQAGGESEEAMHRFRVSLGDLESLPPVRSEEPELQRLKALCLRGIGNIQGQRGNVEAVGHLTQAVEIFRLLYSKDALRTDWETEWVEAYEALGNAYRNLGDKDNAYQVAIDLQSVIEDLLDKPAHETTAAILRNFLAMSLSDQSLYQRDQRDDEAAMKLIGESIELSEQLIAEQPNPIWYVETATVSYHRRAVMWIRRGLPDRALPDAEHAMASSELIAIHNQSPEFKDQAAAYRSLLAICYHQTGKLEAAVKAYRRILQSTKQLAENFPENVSYQISHAGTMANMMSALIDQLQFDEALDLNRQLNDFVTPLLMESPDHPTYRDLTGMIQLEKGRILHRLGSYRQAVEAFDETLEFLQPPRGDAEETGDRANYQLTQSVFDNRSHAYFQLGELQKAIADRQRSFEMDPANVSYHQLALAELFARAGHSDQAIACLERVEEHLEGRPAKASVQLRQAFVHAGLAGAMETSDPEVCKRHWQTAEEMFLQALEKGWGRKSPEQFHAIEQRPWLKPMLEKPAISQQLEQERTRLASLLDSDDGD